MNKMRLLPALALAGALLLPAGVALAQDDATETPADVEASLVPVDPRLGELEALIPASLAGLALGDNLMLATGEELLSIMLPEEADIVLGVLDENDKTVADYAAATSYLSLADTEILVLQAHRIAGIDASETVDAWVEVLSMGLDDPLIEQGEIDGRAVTVISDGSAQGVRLQLFPAGDVIWMIVGADETIMTEAMEAVGADGALEAEAASD